MSSVHNLDRPHCTGLGLRFDSLFLDAADSLRVQLTTPHPLSVRGWFPNVGLTYLPAPKPFYFPTPELSTDKKARITPGLGHRRLAIGHRPSAIGHRPSAIGHRRSAIGDRRFPSRPPIPPIIPLTPRRNLPFTIHAAQWPSAIGDSPAAPPSLPLFPLVSSTSSFCSLLLLCNFLQLNRHFNDRSYQIQPHLTVARL